MMSVDDLADRLKKINLNDSATVATNFVYREVGLANAFVIDVKPGTKVYRYHVRIVKTNQYGRQFNLTEPFTGVGFEKPIDTFDFNVNYLILTAAYATSDGFGIGQVGMVYDNRAIMFTERKIIPDAYKVCREDFDDALKEITDAIDVTVSITESEANEFTLDDPDHYNVLKHPTVDGKEDRGLQSFFEMLTTQAAMDAGFIVAENFFRQKVRHFIGGTNFLDGIKKNVRLVRTANNEPQIKLSIDSITGVFYSPLNLADSLYLVSEFMSLPYCNPVVWEHFRKLYLNVKVTLKYNPRRLIKLKQLSKEPVSQLSFILNGKRITVFQYYSWKYNIDIQYPELPALVYQTKKTADPAYFPLELLLVVVGQKLLSSKYEYLDTPKETVVERILKENAVKPDVRAARISECLDQLILNSSLFTAFGVKIRPSENEVQFGYRQTPKIQLKTATIEPNIKTAFRFGRHQFIECGEFPKIWCFAHVSSVCPYKARQIIDRLGKEAISRGANFKQPHIVVFDSSNNDPSHWDCFFSALVRKRCSFLILFDSKKTLSHANLKNCEAKYGIATQHITIETVTKLNSFENIFNKTNMKLGGLNYKVYFERSSLSDLYNADKLFVLGFDVSHPTNLHEEIVRPSVVGVCYNSAKHLDSFVGNFFYQKGLMEAVDPKYLADSVCNGLLLRSQQRPNSPLIEMCVAYRDGVSDTQYRMIINHEVPAIRRGFEAAKLPVPKIAVIIASKRHNSRLFSKQNAQISNPIPGVIVQQGLMRFHINEFFLQSANAIQGTARPVNYAVIANEALLDMDEIQSFTNGLCYSHQIISSAVSLPEPVFQAHELAKRGANNFAVLCEQTDIPHVENEYDFDSINAEFTCRHHNLLQRRITA